MAKGIKTGGRKKGSLNKKTEEARVKLAKLDCDPMEGMAKIAMDTSNSDELRAKMYSELAQYLHPKLSRSELSQDADNPINPMISDKPMDKDDWKNKYCVESSEGATTSIN